MSTVNKLLTLLTLLTYLLLNFENKQITKKYSRVDMMQSLLKGAFLGALLLCFF